jgi:hypothetical protein
MTVSVRSREGEAPASTTGRHPDGRWVKGFRGGPGRPPVPPALYSRLPELLEVQIRAALVGRMPDGDWRPEDHEPGAARPEVKVSPRDRMTALADLLDRGYGKPRSTDEGDVDGDEVAALTAALVTAIAKVGT